MTTPTDHPPAIPPIGVRETVYYTLGVETGGVFTYDSRALVPHTRTVPLGLSPEQPVRCGGGE